jgi:sugar phosphate isomerase/epimerase
VDYCAEHRCVGAELTSYYFPKEVDEAFLLKLRRHCFLRGIEISGGSVGNTFTNPPGEKRDEQMRYVKQWVDHYAVLGVPHIRVFAGNAPRGVAKDEAKKICIAALEECADYAGNKGIFLGIENHGGIVAEPDGLLDIIRTVKSPWVGINLDSGNFHTDDPYRDFERCAPYAVNVQVKSEIQPRNSQKKAADLQRLVKILRAANYQGYVALEYESDEDPWKAVPGLLQQMAELFAK